MLAHRTICAILIVTSLFFAQVILLAGHLKGVEMQPKAVIEFLNHQSDSLRRQLHAEGRGFMPAREQGNANSQSLNLAQRDTSSYVSYTYTYVYMYAYYYHAGDSDYYTDYATTSQADDMKKSVSAPTVSKPKDDSAPIYDMMWGDADNGFVRFAADNEQGQRVWAEMDKGQQVFKFLQSGRPGLASNQQPRVLLSDSVRNMEIQLGDGKARYRLKATPDNKWNEMGVGRWSMLNGKTSGPAVHPAYQTARPPEPQYSDKQQHDVKIMVLVAAYHDKACGNTLHEAFLRAQYPDRIFIGVVDQYNDQSPDCVEEYCRMQKSPSQCRRSQVRSVRVPQDHSRGVMPARYRQQLLLRDEEFCLQIDAHCMFEYKWDILALKDWLRADNEMAVITTYPHGVGMAHKKGTTPARCETAWNHGIVVDGVVADVRSNPTGRPYMQPFFGAGTVFSKCHSVYNVPYDPYMPYLFKGEEFNQAVRLWTHGYDLYAPLTNFVFHFYDSEKETQQRWGQRTRDFVSMKDDLQRYLLERSERRWKLVVGMKTATSSITDDIKVFGLGTRRSLEAYSDFAKVFFNNQTAVSQCFRLGKFQWVPYEYTDDPSDRFRPSGPSCPAGQSHRCCTNLAKSIPKAKEMLDLTNDGLWTMLKERHEKPNLLAPLRPIYADSDAAAGPCDSAVIA